MFQDKNFRLRPYPPPHGELPLRKLWIALSGVYCYLKAFEADTTTDYISCNGILFYGLVTHVTHLVQTLDFALRRVPLGAMKC